jgi:hypothetical protein
MQLSQNPKKQIEELQLCLSSDKKPIGWFLGAGCPLAVGSSPLIPDIAGMTKKVREALQDDKLCEPLLKILEEQFEKDGKSDFNLEHMLNQIRTSASIAGNDKVRGLSAQDLDRLDETICQTIHELTDKELPDHDTPYHRLASWVESVERDMPVEIFTTNYDLLMEQALEDYRVPYFDGFAGSRTPFFDVRAMEDEAALPARWTRFWKLHGSINWYLDDRGGVFRHSAKLEGKKHIIHPSHLKYQDSRRMPYLAMLDRLKTFLKQPTATLIVTGYSFRDEHLNEIIVQSLSATPTAIAFGLLFGQLGDYTDAVNLAKKRSNLTLLANNGAVIGGREVSWAEVSKDEVLSTSPWVEWIPIDPDNSDSRLKATFALGNFAKLGEFLRHLVGERPNYFGNINGS